MSDVFSRLDTNMNGVFAADHARVSFGPGVPTALVQNLNASYMQNVTRLYEVGNNGEVANIYYVGGRAQGQMSIARVMGPQALLSAFYRKFGNVCNAAQNMMTIEFNPLDCVQGKAKYLFKYCVITQIGVSVQAMEMVVNESSQIMFSSMDFDETPISGQGIAAAQFGAGVASVGAQNAINNPSLGPGGFFNAATPDGLGFFNAARGQQGPSGFFNAAR